MRNARLGTTVTRQNLIIPLSRLAQTDDVPCPPYQPLLDPKVLDTMTSSKRHGSITSLRQCLLAFLLSAILAACASTDPTSNHGRHGDEPDRTASSGISSTRLTAASGVGTQRSADELQAQLGETEQTLHLTPQQAVLWGAYQEKVSALMSDLLRPDPFATASRTAPQQIDAKVDIVRNRLAAAEDVSDAARALYGSLDEQQKSVADRRLLLTTPPLLAVYVVQEAKGAEGKLGEQRGSSRGGKRGMGSMQ